MNRLLIVSIVTGIISLGCLGGGGYLAYRSSNVDADIESAVTICSDTDKGEDSYKDYVDDKTATDESGSYTLFSMYNIDNAVEFMAGTDTTLKLTETGPYAYREYIRREDITFGNDGPNNASSVRQIEKWTSSFDAERTKELGCTNAKGDACDPTVDAITSLNPVLLQGSAVASSESLLMFGMVPPLLAGSYDAAADAGICELVFSSAAKGELDSVIDTLEALKTWENFGWTADHAAFAKSTLRSTGETGKGLGGVCSVDSVTASVSAAACALESGTWTSTGSNWLLDTTGLPEGEDLYADAEVLVALGADAGLQQSRCVCRMIQGQAADAERKVATMLGAANAYAAAGAAMAVDPDPTGPAAAAFAAAKQAFDAAVAAATPAITTMVPTYTRTPDPLAPLNSCEGYAAIIELVTVRVVAAATACQGDSSASCVSFAKECADPTAPTCLAYLVGVDYTAALTDTTAGVTYPACAAGATNKCLVLVGVEANNDFLVQVAMLQHATSTEFVTAMGGYWQKLTALSSAVTLIPAMLPNAATGSPTTDGPLVKHTIQEWYAGYDSPVSAVLTGNIRGFSGYFSPDEASGDAPDSLAKQMLTGCDDISNINFADRRGDAGLTGLPKTTFPSMVSHYPQFLDQGYDKDPSGMRITGYDGKIQPPVKAADWRKAKRTGDASDLRPDTLQVYVSQGYQPVELIKTDANTKVGPGIECTRYELPSDALTKSEDNVERFRSIIFPDVATDNSGVLDISKLTGAAHVVVSKPHFMDGLASLTDWIQLDGKPHGVATSATHPEYTTYVDVDNLIGRTLVGHKRLQANWVLNSGQLDVTCPDCLDGKPIPSYWVDETGTIAPDQAKDLETLQNMIRMLPVAAAVLFALGGVLLVITALLFYKSRRGDMQG